MDYEVKWITANFSYAQDFSDAGEALREYLKMETAMLSHDMELIACKVDGLIAGPASFDHRENIVMSRRIHDDI